MVNIFEIINSCKTIALFAHINPDGDAIGSLMTLKRYIDSLGKDVYVFLQRPISENYYFMGINEVANIKFNNSYDLAISVDCPNVKRFGEYEKEFLKAKISINIDHHMDNEFFAMHNIVDTSMCSACELIYNLFKQSGLNISSDMATCLYSGIATDTGMFLHSNTTASCFLAAGELVKLGADLETLNYNLFNHIKINEFNITRLAISKTEFYENGKIAFVGITSKMLEMANADLTCTYRIIDQINKVDGVEVAVLLTQNGYRENLVSVRSRNRNAQRICKAFGGGGHLRASGCRIFIPFKYAKEKLLEECKKELTRND